MSYVNRFSLCPPSFIALAQGLSTGLAGSAGSNMWLREVESISAPGTVVYGASSGLMETEFSNLLPLDSIDPISNVVTRLSPGGAAAIYAACQSQVPPVAVTLAQINALLAAVLLFDADPFGTLLQLGLRFKPRVMA